MKDYYDLYYLANKFDFYGTVLVEAIKKTFQNRERHHTIEQFEQIMTFDADNGMPQKWNNFARKLHTKGDSFQSILERVRLFISVPFQAVLNEEILCQTWSSMSGAWVRGDDSPRLGEGTEG